MPTPFYHLALAEGTLRDPRLPEAARQLLASEYPAFILGNTAPDVQTLTGQTREATHFFEVPLRNTNPPHEAMFAAWPELAHPPGQSPDRLAFLAGYVCHLLLDQLWIRRLFQPTFGPDAAWGNFPERLYLHNVLRVHLDRQLLPKLSGGIAGKLRAAEPHGWLPFVADEHLRAWRDFLADQLEPGAESLTVSVFAARMGREPAEFDNLLASPVEMDRRVFSRLSREQLAQFGAEGLAGGLRLLTDYLLEPVAIQGIFNRSERSRQSDRATLPAAG